MYTYRYVYMCFPFTYPTNVETMRIPVCPCAIFQYTKVVVVALAAVAAMAVAMVAIVLMAMVAAPLVMLNIVIYIFAMVIVFIHPVKPDQSRLQQVHCPPLVAQAHRSLSHLAFNVWHRLYLRQMCHSDKN